MKWQHLKIFYSKLVKFWRQTFFTYQQTREMLHLFTRLERCYRIDLLNHIYLQILFNLLKVLDRIERIAFYSDIFGDGSLGTNTPFSNIKLFSLVCLRTNIRSKIYFIWGLFSTKLKTVSCVSR